MISVCATLCAAPNDFLRRQVEIALDVQSLACMAMRMDGPGREGQQLPLLVFGRQAVGLLEPAFDRRILAVNNFPHSEEVAGKCRPRRSFDHLLEAAAGNHFGVNIDLVFDQDAEDAFIIAVAWQAATDAIRLDDPQSERFATPDRLWRQAADQDDGKNVTVLGDPLDQLIQCDLESLNFFGIVFLGDVIVSGHESASGGTSKDRSNILELHE